MPYYTYHMDDILEDAGIPLVKAYRVRVDEYVQSILGLQDAEPEQVWAVLHPKLQDPTYRAWFTQELRQRWDARDWRQELL
jgi:hypothetical protein